MKDNKPPKYVYNSNPVTVTAKRVVDEDEASSGFNYRGGSQSPRNNPPNRTRYVKPKYTTTPRVKVKPYVTPVEDIPRSPTTPTTPKVKTPRTPLSLLLPHLPKWITPLIPFILAPERTGDPKLDPFNPNIPGKYLKKVEKPNIDRVLVKPKSKK